MKFITNIKLKYTHIKIAEHPDKQLEINDLEIYCHAAFINLHKKDPSYIS
ncbi:MAG TPA: hypothetical protein VJN02_12510 [Gammaproteobacteria bacterium]|nr:hypothetical protein [Gammaproteobacteria bacterium]